ncbi:MAG TPA: response regulator [Thermoanaerobaculia bacterium]|nr:response regulator [Thermoanaerobaculia bacterium]
MQRLHDVVRILVVDDEPAIRALVARIAQRAGFDVDVARDGAEAIEKLDATQYSVVILDLMMPNVDGYGVIDHVRSMGGQHPAIILISAADSAAFRRVDGSIVHSVIRKPFDIDVLADLINAAAEARSSISDEGNVLPFRKDEVC